MNPLQRIVRWRPVYRWVLKSGAVIEPVERLLRRASGNRIGVLDLPGLPTIRVTVPGRKTGILRTCTLQAIPDGDVLLVVGSNWARAENPAWSANFLAAKQVTVQRRAERFTATVRLLTGQDRQRAWDRILEFWPNYQIALEHAHGREFRLFALTRWPPRPGSNGDRVSNRGR